MKIAITKATAGAGRWAHEGWANALKALGHDVIDITHNHTIVHTAKPDLLINSTSHPSNDLLLWRKNNPDAKVAMNVLAWTTTDNEWVNKPGVQATPNNVQYAKDMKADIVFAQYSPKYRIWLLDKWANEGFKLGSMEMAADSTVYVDSPSPMSVHYPMVYVGGYWSYKGETMSEWLLPVLRKYSKELLLVGKGWPIASQHIDNEGVIGQYFGAAKVCPNMHEPHSTYGGFDVVERVFKTMYCGGLCVSDHVNEMEDGFGFIPGTHLFTAKSPSEYQAIIDEIMSEHIASDRLEHRKVREAGQKFVRENHTYIHRAKQLLKDVL